MPSRPPFGKGSAALVDWLLDLRSGGARHAGPALVLALERLRRYELPPSRRFEAIRLMRTPLLKICAGLPKPWDTYLGAADGSRSLTLEQRLYRLMFQNLNDCLRAIDRRYFLLDSRQARRRIWVVRNLFRFFDRLVRYSARSDAPMPESAWREMHDLSLYLAARRGLREENKGVVYLSELGFDSDLEYRRILLLGLAAQLTGAGACNRTLRSGLRAWAGETRLLDPEVKLGDSGLFLVELSQDRPPRQEMKRLEPDFRGFVLVPPSAYVEALNRTLNGEYEYLPESAEDWRRSASGGS